MILIPLLMALAAPHPSDRLFDAPADISALQPLNGQPLWVLMSRCAKAGYDDSERLENSPFTELDKTMAASYGMSVEERREKELAGYEEAVKSYLELAIVSLAADRGMEEEAAKTFMFEQFLQADPLRVKYIGNSGFATDACPAIRDLAGEA